MNYNPRHEIHHHNEFKLATIKKRFKNKDKSVKPIN